MVVGVEVAGAARKPTKPQEFCDLVSDRARIGTAERALEILAPTALECRHPALPPQRRIGEAIEEVRVLPDQDVEMKWEILAVLEGLEAIEHDRFLDAGPQSVLEQETVTPEPGDLVLHCRRADPELASDLPKTRAGEHSVEERSEEIGPSEPVVDCKRLATEASPAVQTKVTLDAPRLTLAGVEPDPFVAPAGGVNVIRALGLRAMRWFELRLHARSILHGPCETHSSTHNQGATRSLRT